MKYIFITLFFSFHLLAHSQSIKGKIMDEEGNPVPNATIVVKSTNAKLLTSPSGTFSLQRSALSIQQNDTLLISATEFNALVYPFPMDHSPFTSHDTRLTITLTRKIKVLEEVTLNTGYQKLPKERATGSFTQIDNKKYNEQTGATVLERLKYITNGLAPFPQRVGGGPSGSGELVIRGLSTITFSIQKPLVIVDNFEYQGDINNINPNDVESVTFLKDAAAASIWGAKAANGVIVINTKRGKLNQRTKIEFNINTTVTAKPDLFYIKEIAPSDLVEVEQFLFSKNVRFNDTASYNHRPFTPVYEILFKQKAGQLTAEQATAQLNMLRNHDVRNDFENYLYKKATAQQYALGISGGSANIAWLLSLGYDKGVSQLNDISQRFTARFANSYKVSPKLNIDLSLSYTWYKTTPGGPGYNSISSIANTLPVYTQLADDNGDPLPFYNRYRQPYIDTVGQGKLLNWNYYPLQDYKNIQNNYTTQDLHTAIGINYKLFSFLSIDLKYRYQEQTQLNTILYTEQSFFTRDLINTFTQLNDNTGTVIRKVPLGDIYDWNQSRTKAQNIRAQLNINKTVGVHAINALAGAEINELINNGAGFRTYGYNGDILTAVKMDYATQWPLFMGGADFIPYNGGFSKTNNRFASVYANAGYSLKSKYTLSASARRDASNIFGVNTNDKWKPLWSAGAAWNISKENFYRIKYLPYLKWRVSYGSQGNLDPTKVARVTFAYVDVNPFTNTPYGQVVNFPNPDLQWEQVNMFNTAIEFRTKNERLYGSIEFYHKQMKDLYSPSLIDPTTGLGTITITKNIGNAAGHGFDIELNTININGKIKWTTGFFLNTYRMKLTKLKEPALGAAITGGSFIRLPGYPPFAYFALASPGLDEQGDPLGYLNGQPTKDYAAIFAQTKFNEIIYKGSLVPEITGAIANTFSWKNLSLTAQITYKLRYVFRRESINYGALTGSLAGHADYAKRWQKPGDEKTTTVPAFVYPANSLRDLFYQQSEVLAEKGDHIRLQYINLSYAIDKTILKKLPIEKIECYAVISNLGILWRANKKHLDPDYSDRTVPPSKSFSIGIRTNF